MGGCRSTTNSHKSCVLLASIWEKVGGTKGDISVCDRSENGRIPLWLADVPWEVKWMKLEAVAEAGRVPPFPPPASARDGVMSGSPAPMNSQGWASRTSFQNQAHTREASVIEKEWGSEVSRKRVRERGRKDTDTRWGGRGHLRKQATLCHNTTWGQQKRELCEVGPTAGTKAPHSPGKCSSRENEQQDSSKGKFHTHLWKDKIE